MRGILFFIGSSGVGKLLPLLFGMYIANMVGHEGYALLVQVLVQSNFLTTVATVSYVQLILSNKGSQLNDVAGQYSIRAVIFAAIVSIVGGGWAAYIMLGQARCSGGEGCWAAVIIGLVVAVYALGNSTLTIVMAQFNSDLQNARAGLSMFVGLLVPYGVGFFVVWADLNYLLVFSIVAILLMVVALGLYWRRNMKLLVELNSKEFLGALRQSLPLERGQIHIMVFVGAILFSHSYAISQVNLENGAQAAAVFALGYQLFAVGLFVPGALGNVVVPRLSREKEDGAVNMTKLFGVYVTVALVWLASIYLLGKPMLAWYGLEINSDNMAILLILQGAVVFGAINALLNQQLAAKKNFFALAMLALLYLAVLYMCGVVMGFAADFAAAGILISYMTVVVVGTILIRAKGIL